jgi:pilus assembly protein CpaD
MTTVSSTRSGRAASSSAKRAGTALTVAASAFVLALAGCAQTIDPYEVTGAVPEDYRTNHPILIEEQIAVIDIPVSANSARLTEQARANVAFFAQSFTQSGANVIAVVAPSGSPNQVAAAAAAVEIEDVLRRSGVPAGAIDYRVYPASAAERIAPVRLAYNRIVAHTAPCRPWSDQATVTDQNRHYGDFGCATQQNTAAMVTNPLDLLYPRGMTPADAARRTAVLNSYRTGAPLTSSQAGQSGGSVSGVGQ